MIRTVGTTTNFVVNYQDTDTVGGPIPNAKRRAQQLLATCEADFTDLRSWFGLSGGFGASNRVTLQVEPESLGRNFGYKTGGKTFIRTDPLDTAAVQEQGDAGVQALFVAEMIEVLMDYRNVKTKTTTWHGGFSDGEGLSRVAAATLHPDGYYGALPAPVVNTWLQGTRGNWVATNDPTDTSADSFGCAILFIYYLRDQLNFSMPAIVQKAGETLEETYQNLTGQSNGFKAFRDLLNTYLPASQMTALLTDDPFPILTGQNRRVDLHFKEVMVGGPQMVGRGKVTVSPFFTCPAKSYTYTSVRFDSRLRCLATVTGFAQPKFAWRVNGLRASSGGSIRPTATVLVDQPQHPDVPATVTKVVGILWDERNNAVEPGGITGELDLRNTSDNHEGHEQLTVEVTVSESFGSTDTVTQTGSGTLDTAAVFYEDAFYADRDECAKAFQRRVSRWVRVKWIPIVFTLPDPAPELRAGIRMLKEVVAELRAISARDPQLGAQVARALAGALQVPETMLAAPRTERGRARRKR